MRVVIYGPASNGGLGFLADGFKALRHEVRWREDRGAYRKGEVEDFDLAVTDGVRPPMNIMRDDYVAAGIPVWVTDLGYVRRDLGYLQLGVNRLNWIPEIECPPDRWNALGVELQPRRHGEYILITGQKPDDGQHLMSEMELWLLYTNIVTELRKHTDREIVFRPHPWCNYMAIDRARIDKPTDIKSGGLAEAIAGAHAVVTYNSTSATDALIAGVPVFCHESAQASGIANNDLSQIENPYFPSDEVRQLHFNRVGYSQWLVRELESGIAAEFVLRAMSRSN